MELQPGQINWGQWNAQPLPGAVRMWIWHCFGLGEKFVCTYRFRQPLFGSEQFHNGIMETDGTTVSRGGQEYVTAIREINNLKNLTKRSRQFLQKLLQEQPRFMETGQPDVTRRDKSNQFVGYLAALLYLLSKAENNGLSGYIYSGKR